MLALAEFVMRSRRNASLVVAIGMIIPIGAWLSSAITALVLLRYGIKEFLSVAGIGLIAGVFWWIHDSSSVIWILLGVSFLAVILRACKEWQAVILASMVVGIISAFLIYATQDQILNVAEEMITRAYVANSLTPINFELQTTFRYMALGCMAVIIQLATLTSLMLARYWQAALYNVGGFGREFRNLKLNTKVALCLVVLVLAEQFCSTFYQVLDYATLIAIVRIPLIMGALALAHSLTYSKRWHVGWLVMFYVSAITPAGILLCVIATIDSFLDIRRLGATHT